MKIISLIAVMAVTMSVQAQWLPPGATTGNIYNSNSGNVGIGTSSPTSKMEVRGPSIRISDMAIRYLEISQDDQGQPYGRNWTNSYAGGRQFKLTGWSHLPDNTGSLQKDIVHFDGYNLLLLKDNGGSVGIGTSKPDAALAVKGAIHAYEVRVDLNVPGPDYVFEESYPLTTLKKLNEYIQQNKHLPEIPSACFLEENGVNLGEMNMLLLKKVEELTLYAIDQNNQAEVQNKRLQEQEDKIKELERLIHNLIKSDK